MNKKIGLVVTFKLSAGGGAPRLIVDLINTLNYLGHKVYLLNPFKLDYQKIKEIYEPIKIEKIYNLNKLKGFFCRERIFSRKLLKKQFQNMAEEVDMIIDIDGGILHNYLPKDFDKSKYIVWRFTAIGSQIEMQTKKSFKRIIKNNLKKILNLRQTATRYPISRKHKIYSADEWTRDRLIKNWGFDVKDVLYHPIHIKDFLYKGNKKKNQIVNLGRLAQNRMIETSIYIFAKGIKNFKDYELILIGGITSDSKIYIKYLKKFAKDLGVLNKVKFIINPSTNDIKEILSNSKVLLDTQLDISAKMPAIEAMASGCVVLTPDSCGTYKEVLRNGKFGYGYKSIEDGVEKFKLILNKLDKNEINLKEFIKRAKFYSLENFRNKLKEIIENE